MLKRFLHRLLRQTAAPPQAEEPALGALTVLAVEPQQPEMDLVNVDHLFFPWLLGTRDAVPAALNETENRVLRALKREADSNDPATADLVPRLPSVIPVLLRSLRDRNVSNAQLAGQVAQDPVLVAAVLRQVNTSWYRRATTVRTIEEAVAVIGQNGLRMLVASVAFKPLFSASLGPATTLGAPRMWELAEPFGFACRYLGGRAGADEFEVFLAGLLRNVGVIVALRIVDQAAGAGVEARVLRSLAFHAAFIHYARRLAQVIGTEWAFPPAAVAAAGAEPGAWESAAEGLGVDARAAVTLQVLGNADRLAKLKLMLQQGALREDLAEACLEGADVLACWHALTRLERPQEN
ncbi:MAG TPA: HDOD domain-containing protein [Noviherbaspirillum sp.]|uniref:HDOD domain-containing protein n=1 Tax=Noviherbaspirillum sp. TaxID=1926288 RepID=UPI002F93EE9F